ncbi:MAG: sensor histidine kinase [Candidatus Binataceae bacterium]
MKIGTRLTAILLLCLLPVLAAYMYFGIRQATHTYVSDLKRETRATARALGAALGRDIELGEWSDVRLALERTREEYVAAAIFGLDGKQTMALAGYPIEPAPAAAKLVAALHGDGVEFMQTIGDQTWFCRAAALRNSAGKPIGILLVSQRWNDVRNDLRSRVLQAVLASMLVAGLIAFLIPAVSQRYVARPLADLSAKVARMSSDDSRDTLRIGDEVEYLGSEFRRLATDLETGRRRLLDETERKLELERELRRADKLAAIGTLASGVAHEIGTPLSVIRGRAEHLNSNRQNPPRTAEGLEIIIHQIDRITRIVRMLLDLGARREQTFVACDLRVIAQRTLALLETETAHRGVRCQVELGAFALEVRCDADQIQQVFVNLAMNAMDAMGPQGGTLNVSAATANHAGRRVVIVTFADTGPGIAPDVSTRVFDPFFTTKEPGKGTGMGLAVSDAIVRDHQGEIALESSVGGARISVTLPLADALSGPRGGIRRIA